MKRKTRALGAALFLALFATSCCRSTTPTPSGGGAAGGAAATSEKPSLALPAILGGPKDVAAPASFDAPPFSAGATSRMRVTKGGQPDGEQIVKILSVSGDQVRVEIESVSAKGERTIVQSLLRVRDRRVPSGLDLLEAQLKRGAAAPMKLSGPQLKASQGLLGNQTDGFAWPDAAKNPRREDITVPAGTYRGCVYAERESTVVLPLLGARKTKMRSWYHPAVGTNGLVKQEATTNGETQLLELAEASASGARSAL